VRNFWKLLFTLVMSAVLLSGCNMLTVNQMYRIPKRSEEDTNIQSLINRHMSGLEYSAPLSGEHQQTVQQADLNGDGIDEYLLFTRSVSSRTLKIFIFTSNGEEYYLLDTIEPNGSAFEQVEYVNMNDVPGKEIVLGCQVSDQVLRAVSVYSMSDGTIEQSISENYTKFLCTDLDGNGLTDLFLLCPGTNASESGVAEVFAFNGSNMERSREAKMSEPTENIKRIMVGELASGENAVFVASEVGGSGLITDVFSVVRGNLTNVALSNESGTNIQTLRNYFVYAEDIDNDGVLELPSLVLPEFGANQSASDYVVRWFALRSSGKEVTKKYTYHNQAGGWYLELDPKIASSITVSQEGNSYEFLLWNEDYSAYEKLLTIHVLTGQRREEQAVVNNRFVLYRTDTTIYAANLEVASAAHSLTKETLLENFKLIVRDWYDGMT
jgi:hypothetical protein